jgi:integrase
MPRQQLPPQIRKIEVTDRKTGKTVVRYQVTVDGGINPETGKRQQVRRRYATEKLARDGLSAVTSAAATGSFVPRKAVTVEELCEDWLASLHHARATTLNAYVYSIAPLRERHGDLPVQKLTRPDLDKLLVDLRNGGTRTAKGRTRRSWSARSLNKAVDAWRTMLAYGVERREIAHNVAAAMKKAPRTHAEMKTYTPDEIRQVLRVADGDRNGHVWYLALSGLRRGEIAGLRWSDIDLDARTVSIERNRVQAGAGNVVENDPKTLSSRRTLPLDDGLAAVLRLGTLRRGAPGVGHCPSGFRLRRGQRDRRALHPRHAYADVAEDGQGRRCAPDQAARCTPLLRHGDAPARRPGGSHREVAGPRQPGGDHLVVRALAGRRT